MRVTAGSSRATIGCRNLSALLIRVARYNALRVRSFFPLPAVRGEVGLRSNPGEGRVSSSLSPAAMPFGSAPRRRAVGHVGVADAISKTGDGVIAAEQKIRRGRIADRPAALMRVDVD